MRIHWTWQPVELLGGCVYNLEASFAKGPWVSVAKTRGNHWWVESDNTSQRTRARVECYDRTTEQLVDTTAWSEISVHRVNPLPVSEPSVVALLGACVCFLILLTWLKPPRGE